MTLYLISKVITKYIKYRDNYTKWLNYFTRYYKYNIEIQSRQQNKYYGLDPKFSKKS